MNTFNERLIAERKRLGMGQEQFAAAGGVGTRTQANYEADPRVPDMTYLDGVSKIGADVLFLVTGRRAAKPRLQVHGASVAEPSPKWPALARESSAAPVRPDTLQRDVPLIGGFSVTPSGGLLVPAGRSHAQPLRLPVGFDGGRVIREFQVIPKYKASASAGTADGREVRPDDMAVDAAGVMAMDRAFMREQLGGDGPGFVSVLVKGDSMERTLIDGETIIIDSTINEVDGSGIYVVRVGKNLLVKRLVLRMDGGVLVKSDNPAYAVGDAEYSPDQAQSIAVVGRMVWPKFR